MTNKQILFERIVSADGRSIAEASTFGNKGSKITQSVTVKTTSSGHFSSSSSSSNISSSS